MEKTRSGGYIKFHSLHILRPIDSILPWMEMFKLGREKSEGAANHDEARVWFLEEGESLSMNEEEGMERKTGSQGYICPMGP